MFPSLLCVKICTLAAAMTGSKHTVGQEKASMPHLAGIDGPNQTTYTAGSYILPMWNAELIPEAALQIRNILMQIRIRILLFTLIRIRIPLPFALMRMRIRFRILSFNLLRIQIRILPLTVFQIRNLQCSKLTL
jgi:hypothetical protein